MTEETTVNLGDFLSEKDVLQHDYAVLEECAARRHVDYDEVIDAFKSKHQITKEQAESILTDDVDPAEAYYQMAKASMTKSAEELYNGDGGPASESEPGSAEDIYNP